MKKTIGSLLAVLPQRLLSKVVDLAMKVHLKLPKLERISMRLQDGKMITTHV